MGLLKVNDPLTKLKVNKVVREKEKNKTRKEEFWKWIQLYTLVNFVLIAL